MSPLQEQLETLRREHQTLQAQLEQETQQKYPNQMAITEIKRKKLKIKDAIEELTRTLS